VKLKVNAVA